MAEEDECMVPIILREGTFHGWGGVSEIQQGKYSPQKVGGFRPNEGDTHNGNILEVPDCPE
jgi:hypothetical protein